MAGEFDKVRGVAAEIEERELRGRLERLAALGETLRAIDSGAPSIGELSPPLYSCLAYLSLAGRQFYEDGLPQDAASTLALAKIAAGKLDVSARPFILLAAARLEAAINLEAAHTTLTAAVTAFNTLDEEQAEHPKEPSSPRPDKSRTLVSDRGVSEVLRADRSHSSIPLRISRIEGYRFEKVLPAFMEADPARVEAILEHLRSERRLAEALAFSAELRFIH